MAEQSNAPIYEIGRLVEGLVGANPTVSAIHNNYLLIGMASCSIKIPSTGLGSCQVLVAKPGKLSRRIAYYTRISEKSGIFVCFISKKLLDFSSP